ncbi:MAG TPA: hypothetical protein PLP50_06335 [Thermoanaerobaculia bacterium]|jgi:hypothetical protein|nr:hypothetical protein [Thermoanaerobaculia bacterium]HPA51203.1 hypothetical protein [Thermoanaerobaculia bacterium]HQN08740.1 hypothetical protein [Thermoanaerobaculia bacterium]HQP85598.1 hypothetical protein [Thermoanaerobaculia bacterium]
MTGSRGSLTARLIARDLHHYRWLILGTAIAGAASLVLTRFGDGDGISTGPNVGFLLLLTTVIVLGVALPMLVLKEHETRSDLFVLSLPVSAAQYSFAKVASALAAFLLPWTALTGGAAAVTALSPAPDGSLPFFVATMTFLLVNFCLLMALTVITRSEPAAIAGILVTNFSVTVFMSRLARLPGVAGRSKDAVATWSPEVLAVLAVELVVILLSLALAFYVPSRRRDAL